VPTTLLVDGQNLLHRSLHGSEDLTRSDDKPVGAVIAFVVTLGDLLKRHRITDGVVVFDGPGSGFRKHLCDNYKAMREGRDFDEGTRWQISMMMEAVRVTGMTTSRSSPYEADDVISTLAWRAKQDVIIASDDKDLGFLCSKPHVRIHQFRDRATVKYDQPFPLVGKTDVSLRWGVEPHMVPHVQTLCGDGGDGVAGLRGVGKAKAASMLVDLHSAEAVAMRVELFKGTRWKEHASMLHDIRRMRDVVTGVVDAHTDALPGKLVADWASQLASVLMSMESRRHLHSFLQSNRLSSRRIVPLARLAAKGAKKGMKMAPKRTLF
jgi:5'-3' exonuclease